MASLLKSVLQKQTFLQSLTQPQSVLPSIIARPLASSSEAPKKALSVLFEEAVGLRPRTETSEIGDEDNELKRKLLELERTLIDLKESEPAKKKEEAKIAKAGKKRKKIEKRKSLYALFTGDKNDEHEGTEKKEDDRPEQAERIRVFKELPLEMVSFLRLLHKEGYFSKANFLLGSRLEMGCFDEEYARAFVKFAAERFGRDHQEIAKWLSGSKLKNIVLFGCPSLDRRTVFSAKSMRKFFEIQEDTVCSKCMLKEKCKFPNQSVWGGNTKNLHLSDVMKVITLYPLDLTHPELQVPEEIHVSVARLLEEVEGLSQTVSSRLA